MNANPKPHAAACIGVLLVNLGTPESPRPKQVRNFLREFLSDPRVVELPRVVWLPILYALILPLRARASARNYKKIWRADGSPLLAIGNRQAAALQQQLHELQPHARMQVALAMRYAQPSIAQSLAALREQGAHRIVVLPLYPQYAAATTASVFDAVADALRDWRHLPELRFVNRYHDDAGYINALAAGIRNFRAQHGAAEKLVMSFHGLPQRQVDSGDPYYSHCLTTAQLLAETLQLGAEQWLLAFQSRFGRAKWLQPDTTAVLQELARGGCRHVQVVCPGFAADCLETLEEIDMQNRDIFLRTGGEKFEYIACLNDNTAHIRALADIVVRHAKDRSNT